MRVGFRKIRGEEIYGGRERGSLCEKAGSLRWSVPMPLECHNTAPSIKRNSICDSSTICAVFNTCWTVINHIKTNDGGGFGSAEILFNPSYASGVGLAGEYVSCPVLGEKSVVESICDGGGVGVGKLLGDIVWRRSWGGSHVKTINEVPSPVNLCQRLFSS